VHPAGPKEAVRLRQTDGVYCIAACRDYKPSWFAAQDRKSNKPGNSKKYKQEGMSQ
jgi:hypothetical protein